MYVAYKHLVLLVYIFVYMFMCIDAYEMYVLYLVHICMYALIYIYAHIIFFIKCRFVYPPGYGEPDGHAIDSLTSMYQWFINVYPLLLSFHKPNSDIKPENNISYRPLECTQKEGDVVYIPAGFSHQTINIGDTIAIGGQASYPADKR